MPISPSLSLSGGCGLLRRDEVGVASSVAMGVHSAELALSPFTESVPFLGVLRTLRSELASDFAVFEDFFADFVEPLLAEGELTGLKKEKRLLDCSRPLLRFMAAQLSSLNSFPRKPTWVFTYGSKVTPPTHARNLYSHMCSDRPGSVYV